MVILQCPEASTTAFGWGRTDVGPRKVLAELPLDAGGNGIAVWHATARGAGASWISAKLRSSLQAFPLPIIFTDRGFGAGFCRS
jgi:hypothetical protein